MEANRDCIIDADTIATCSAARGQEVPPTFCGPAPVPAATAFRGTLPAGPKIPAPSLAVCVAQTLLRKMGIEITFSREGRVVWTGWRTCENAGWCIQRIPTVLLVD
jgi:hypothetical protein